MITCVGFYRLAGKIMCFPLGNSLANEYYVMAYMGAYTHVSLQTAEFACGVC